MKLYNKKELLDKLNNGFDLRKDEYRVLIKNGRYELSKRLFMLDSEDYVPTLLNYTTLGMLASKMDYYDDDEKSLPRACTYMIASLGINTYNYVYGLEDSDIAYSRLCRYNTINFIREVEEIKKYEDLIGNLHDSISNVVDLGFTYETPDELQDRMNDLEESRTKIKVFRNKYIK